MKLMKCDFCHKEFEDTNNLYIAKLQLSSYVLGDDCFRHYDLCKVCTKGIAKSLDKLFLGDK